MPRIRSIKPQFWLDEKLGEICRDARLLYIGLWNLCDDQGVFEWRSGRIKAQLFPYDKDISGQDLGEWLKLLEGTGDIIKFTNAGKDFGYIPTFLNHQIIKNPSQRRFALIPQELLAEPTPALPQPYPSTNPALTVGSREEGGGVGSRFKGIGSRESNIDIKYKEDGTLDEENTFIQHQSVARIKRILAGDMKAPERNKKIYRRELKKLLKEVEG